MNIIIDWLPLAVVEVVLEATSSSLVPLDMEMCGLACVMCVCEPVCACARMCARARVALRAGPAQACVMNSVSYEDALDMWYKHGRARALLHGHTCAWQCRGARALSHLGSRLESTFSAAEVDNGLRTGDPRMTVRVSCTRARREHVYVCDARSRPASARDLWNAGELGHGMRTVIEGRLS